MNISQREASRFWTADSTYMVLTPSLTAKSSFCYIQEAGHFHALADYMVVRKNLQSYLLVYTVSGEGVLRYDGKKYEVGKGQLFFIDCEKDHSYKTIGDNIWEFYALHFYGGMCAGYYHHYESLGGPVITLPEQTNIPKELGRLMELNIQKNAATELVNSKKIIDLLTELMLQKMRQGEAKEAAFYSSHVQKAVDEIHENYDQKITLDRLAKVCSVNKYHLVREFKKELGLTPHEYLIVSRINGAKDLLKYSDASISEIGLNTGFDSASHFIESFKKHEQITPLNFRKHWR